jgi:AcrR family transcriptional regulator
VPGVNPVRAAAVGLRERKRIAAMRRIQAVAVDLFDEHGFDGVTVEQIAAEAEVSPSSIYRYFQTKEGVLIGDEYEIPLMEGLLGLLAEYDIYDAVRVVLVQGGRDHFVSDAVMSRRRARYWIEVPSVRSALHLRVDRVVPLIAQALADPAHTPHRDVFEARVVASSVLWALVAALEQVVTGACDLTLTDAFDKAVAAIAPGRARD